MIGFDWFGAFKDAPGLHRATGSGEPCGSSSGLLRRGRRWRCGPCDLRPGLVAVVLSIVGLVTAFFVMIDSNFGAALGAALLPAIILWYLYTKEGPLRLRDPAG